MIGGGRIADESGSATVEAAFALASLVTVLVLCLAGVGAVSAQIRCIDAAREAARLAARGDGAAATAAGSRIAPEGAVVQLRTDGALVVARVTARHVLLPGLAISAEAISVTEPGR